jgi:hypothetical protein
MWKDSSLLEMIVRNWVVNSVTELTWLRIAFEGGLL